MLHRHISTLNQLGGELIYNDQITGEPVTGVVGRIEYIAPNVAFVYIVSPYQDENRKEEDGFRYKDIMVFDDRPDTEFGWHKNTIEAMAKKPIER